MRHEMFVAVDDQRAPFCKAGSNPVCALRCLAPVAAGFKAPFAKGRQIPHAGAPRQHHPVFIGQKHSRAAMGDHSKQLV